MTTAYLHNVLNSLHYDFSSFQLDDFIRHLYQHTGRQIHLFPIPMPPDMFGAWISDAETKSEYIFYRDSLPPIHKQHTILHELAHFILGHPTCQITKTQMETFVQGFEVIPDTAARRGPKNSQYETEAEALAGLLQTKIQHQQQSPLTGASSEASKMIKQLRFK